MSPKNRSFGSKNRCASLMEWNSGRKTTILELMDEAHQLLASLPPVVTRGTRTPLAIKRYHPFD
eukprot:scaffold255749_cov41-Attheya_sp.AAC.2